MQPNGRSAAVYVRASTGGQDPSNQAPDCERLATARGLSIVRTYAEHASAASSSRPVFAELVDAARRGEFDTLVVWALDRIGRSLAGNVRVLLELERFGVRVISVREPWLDTSGPVRELLVSIFSWVAQQERERLGERTRAGIERARRQGKRVGRPPRAFTFTELVAARKMKRGGKSTRAIAKAFGVPESTMRRALATRPIDRPEDT